MSNEKYTVGQQVLIVSKNFGDADVRSGIVSKVGRRYVHAASIDQLERLRGTADIYGMKPDAFPFVMFDIATNRTPGGFGDDAMQIWTPEGWEAEKVRLEGMKRLKAAVDAAPGWGSAGWLNYLSSETCERIIADLEAVTPKR
ncbi:hypothetical protein Bequi_13870 [Brachybacterium sp. JHP9]|uniref:Uncharacterized protein n=1 Tax=Brachybacterium equifaecis TaxID=2910770 RepID=A0ABT0R3D8_9MICO|nr:hypothetical protein [Brachybacterium equifaecis]MCL6424453.1 hypothetical protein [Brachybacterium equifaecis]